MRQFAHGFRSIGCQVLHKSRYYDTFLSDLQEKEAEIILLANIAEERNLALSQKEMEIQQLTEAAEERRVALVEKIQIQLLFDRTRQD